MYAARGSGDGLVHQRPAQIVGPGVQAYGGALRTHLHPGRLDVLDQRMQDQPGHGVHQYGLAKARTRSRSTFTPQWRFHVHIAQRHKFGDAACTRLQGAQALQMPGPVDGLLHMSKHDGGRRAQTHLVSGSDHFQPFVRTQLVRADDVANLVIQDLGGRSR